MEHGSKIYMETTNLKGIAHYSTYYRLKSKVGGGGSI